ncbi:MAG: SufD family Fe-S cluster assembly protein [Firmicutes bacterium]|nr:SufD family Fe-S cluster assembly protein [Bacillota bacterium]MBQ7242462.1 SufD family Fe-S cluster assembly protein [Bacillota bacterium]
MDAIERALLKEVAGLHKIPTGAYNIRKDGESAGRNTTANIDIVSKSDKSGIDIYIKDNTVNQSVHIPALITKSGITDLVYNDFHIGENCDVLIVAGCGVHIAGDEGSSHSGVHSFYVGRNSKVVYVEKHLGMGEGTGERVINPVTYFEIEEGGTLEMETTQIRGVTSTERKTEGKVGPRGTIIIKEKIMTHDRQWAKTDFNVDLDGEDSKADLISRSVAQNDSKQMFVAKIFGNNRCMGHSECDAIIMDNGSVAAIPEITANSVEATLIHEAAIGKIAGEQLTKLMTLGLSEKEAEEEIIKGFLK